MIPALANFKSRLIRCREWELNPVIVKELRQAVRSWAVTGMLLLFLTVLFGASLVSLVTHSFTSDPNERLGAHVFQVFYAILAGASFLFIPLYVGVRMAAERLESNLDLLYTSTLTPGSIVRGKFLSGAYTTVLFFSACAPFMAFTNLLRGVDLPTIFVLLSYLYVVLCLAIMLAIFLACLPVSRAFKVVIGLCGLIGSLFMFFPMVFMSWSMMVSGVGAMVVGPGFWSGFWMSALAVMAVFTLLYFLSVALISPPSVNRALPLRGYLSLIWCAGGGLSWYGVFHFKETRVILPWAIMTFVAMVVALLVIISNCDQLSLRVRRAIPAGGLRRALAFPFFNGAAGGLVWAALIVLGTYATAVGVLKWPSSGIRAMAASDVEEFIPIAGAAIAYMFAYALTGLFVQRRFFSTRSPKFAGLFALLVAAGLALIPNIVLFLMNRLSWLTLEMLQLGNVFNLFVVKSTGFHEAHLVFSLCWVALAVALNVRWFLSQARHFRRLESGTHTAQAAVPPPLPPMMPPAATPEPP